jgi:para-nitrobenzyl esterase
VGVRTTAEAAAAAGAVSATLGCDTAVDELACLRAAPVVDLLDAAVGPPEGNEADLGMSIDGGFLPLHPRQLLDAGEFAKVPYILGANSDEGTLFFIGSTPITTDAEYMAELFLRYGAYATDIATMYPSAAFSSPQDALIRVMGDSTLVCSTYDVARRFADAKGKTFVYTFDQVPPLPFIAALKLGAFHGLEIAYVFGSITPPSGIDAVVGQQMREYWTRFAEKGKPKATQASAWPRFKSKTWKMLRFDRFLQKTKDYRRAECDFWRDLYETGGF